MVIPAAIAALIFLIELALVLAGLVNRRRSILLAVVALVIAIRAGGGAWYAWADSGLSALTLRHGFVFVIALVAFVRQFVIVKENTSTTEERRP